VTNAVPASGDLTDSDTALFTSNGILINQDDDDDTRYMSALSFGIDGRASSPAGQSGWSVGKEFNGRDGSKLAAGTYYYAVCPFPGTFGNGFFASSGGLAAALGCRFTIRAGNPSSISGVVNLLDWTIDEVGQNVAYEIRNSASALVQSGTIVLNAGGAYTLAATVPNGTYTVSMKGTHWLNQASAGLVLNGGAVVQNFSLINGDVNNDNFVGFDDFDILSASFNLQLGDAGYQAGADLNGDDFVGFDDFDILSANFNTSGD